MDLVNSKIDQGPDEMQPGIGIWKFGGVGTKNRKSGIEKRDEFKMSPASQFCSGLALSTVCTHSSWWREHRK